MPTLSEVRVDGSEPPDSNQVEVVVLDDEASEESDDDAISPPNIPPIGATISKLPP